MSHMTKSYHTTCNTYIESHTTSKLSMIQYLLLKTNILDYKNNIN